MREPAAMPHPVDVEALLTPISEEEPCGPDLDAAGDGDFLNFMADTEGRLPAAFFSFDPRQIDFKAAFEAADGFLERTRDVRLLVLLGKLALLDRDLAGFAGWMEALARLLAEQWDWVNPRGEDGDFLSRMAPLYTLDDGPVVLMPLQHVTLAETGRDGRLTFRAQLVAEGEARARENEQIPAAAAIDKILANADLDGLRAVLASLVSVRTSLATIRASATDHAGFEQAVKLKALPPLVDRMIAFLQAAVTRRDPSAAPEAESEPAAQETEADAAAPAAKAAKPGEIASRADAGLMLDAALDYFQRNEPSSPAVLLVGQARQLLGRNLFEVMQVLVPNYADSARVHVGSEPAFLVQLSAVPSSSVEESEPTDGLAPAAADRAAALALMAAVATYSRATEPSSPVPLLLERARALCSRDFLGLLKELFPEDVVSSMRIGGSG